MYKLLPATVLALLSTPLAAAPTQDWSAMIGKDGLARTEAALAALPDPSADDLFALGMTRFLGGVEQGLQARWRMGQSEEGFLPVFRLPVTPNPHPAPFDPALIETVFKTLDTRMDDAREALLRIPAGGDVALPLHPDDLWFDINGSGTRDEGEAIVTVGASFLAQPRWNPDTGEFATPETPKFANIRFDTADVAWLTAYTHLLSGTADMVRAFQPTPVIERVMKGRMAMLEKGIAGPLDGVMPETVSYPNEIDLIAISLLSLRQQPLPEHTRAARDHFLAMVAENRRFWTEVAAEADNDGEWIPNKHQTSALGPAFPEGTDLTWLAVLDDAEKLLKGELLAPYFDFMTGSSANDANIGFDLAAWLQDPAPVDLVEWLHGMGITPWLKSGPVVTSANMRAFEELVSGNGVLFAIWFN